MRAPCSSSDFTPRGCGLCPAPAGGQGALAAAGERPSGFQINVGHPQPVIGLPPCQSSGERAPKRFDKSASPRSADAAGPPVRAPSASHRTVSDGRSAPLPIQITSRGTKSRASPLPATDNSQSCTVPAVPATRAHASSPLAPLSDPPPAIGMAIRLRTDARAT